MADIKVRQLDARVASTLKTRAARRGVSLEEEVRNALGVGRGKTRRLSPACRRPARAGGRAPGKRSDSARTIRQERDATG